MNDTEHLIKEALGKQAERAPHPGPTLSALRRPARKRSRSSLFLTIGTAFAAAAVLFVAGVLVGNLPRTDDGAAVLAPTTTAPAPPVSMKYGPGWVPDNFVEVYRSADADGVTRVWLDSPFTESSFASGKPMVTMTVDGIAEGYESWEPVALPGGTGYVKVAQGQSPGLTATLVWRAPEVLRVTVRGVPDVRETAIQIASSVRPDQSVVRSAVEYQGMSSPRVWGSSPTDWTSELRVDPVTARVSTHPPDLSGGKPVKVRGKDGTFVPGPQPLLAVLDRGVWLVITGSLTEGQMVNIANEVKIDSDPGYTWIGSRP